MSEILETNTTLKELDLAGDEGVMKKSERNDE